jgi:hypothetical protein
VQQITNPDDIHRFLKVALQRVKACAGEGRRRIRDSDNSYSNAAEFTSAAELAATLVTFDNHT